MNQLRALYAIAIALALMPLQSAFAEVGDITISEVEFRDITECMGEVYCGGPLMLSATITNNSTQLVSYVALIELRDRNDVTQYLEFHLGRLDPDASSNIASSWTPDKPGEYGLRVFAISDFENPEILSRIETATEIIS